MRLPYRAPARRRPVIAALLAATLAVGPLALVVSGSGSAAAPAAAAEGRQLYIVQTTGDPLVTYAGGTAGLARTQPREGRKVDPRSPAAREYAAHLESQHDRTLARAGIDASRKRLDYNVVFNGYAAALTAAEADTLRRTPGVARVWKNEVRRSDTTTTPTFLRLAGPGGTWRREFRNPDNAGKRMIVGVIDSGFWPENPSFGAFPTPRSDDGVIARKWQGTCDAGTEEPVTCNNKVLGARWYNTSDIAEDYEFLSPRDYNGHGSHTASTTAGNNAVPATINGGPVGNVSGMAPGARLSIYKALWHNDQTGGAEGGTADLVAAIDDAVADGVDVINYSVSGSRTLVVTPDEIAFLNAVASGVFVATSAGNSGDTVGVSSVAHNAPWTMTVAASTHDRGSAKTVTLGNGATYDGVGVGPALPASPLIDSAVAGMPGSDPTEATLCFSGGVLDPAKVAGKVVLCQRGVNARTDKSIAVRDAGGVGMILFNPTPNSLNADFHAVPSIHVDEVSGAAIKAYAATANPTAAISAVSTEPVRAPAMGSFSSFGPALSGGGDLLKPDIAAPGVDVIAAVAPPGHAGNTFDAISGTSMSTPHIAGIATLLKSKHPDWSPMWIKSALMTNATPWDNQGLPIQRLDEDATPLDYGAGHVRAGLAFDPGVVYDSTPTDWIAFGCSLGQIQLVTEPGACDGFPSIDPSDLNYPSLAVGDVAGAQTLTRTLTNISKRASQYRANVQVPPGFRVRLAPARLTIPPGRSRTFRITFTRTSAPLAEWSFGAITWRDQRGHVARSPIALRPVALAAPESVAGTGTSGSTVVSVQPGYTGTLTASVAGLQAATVTPLPLDETGPAFDPDAPAASTRTGVVSIEVPAGTPVARVATYDADYPADTDVDLFLYRVEGTERVPVGQSAGGTSEESITLKSPATGIYEAYVSLFDATTATLTVEPNSWAVPVTAAGNMTATPASQAVTTSSPASVTVAWSGLTAASRYLGMVLFGDGTSEVGRTLVTVE